jgi:cobalt/nickel transport system ATP-binding protein
MAIGKGENIAVIGENGSGKSTTINEIAKRVEEMLAQLHISHLRSRSPLKLSGGEKRMAAIATVLAMGPSLLMFDEPTAFLDHKARRSLIEAFKKLPHTKIVATHDLPFVAEVCERIYILKSGQIAANGSTSLLRDKELMHDCGLEAIE